MNGAKVLTFAMDVVPNNVEALLKRIKISRNKIDKFIFHQASKYILDNINSASLKKIKLSRIMAKWEIQYQPQFQLH